MIDRTRLFFELSRQKLEQRGPSNTQPYVRRDKVVVVDKFKQECIDMYQTINNLKGFFIKIRPAYLSNTKRVGSSESLNEKQRDEIDYEAKMILQQQWNRLQRLIALEEERVKRLNNQNRFPFLSDSKKHGMSKTLELHRSGIFWFLNNLLKNVSDLHGDQQRIRLTRQVEKAKSSLHHIDDDYIRPRPPPSTITTTTTNGASTTLTLTPELEQELVTENNALLDELQVSYNKARQAEKSMNEIAELQTTLATHLATQSETIGHLLEDAIQTTDDVSMANQQLASARTRNRIASKIIIYVSVILALLLLFFDYTL
jgi:syntaxin 18